MTHNNALSDAGTECVIEMLHAAFRGEGLEGMEARAGRLVAEWPQFEYGGRVVENPSGYIVDTLQAVFQGLFAGGGFEETVVGVVNRGGDADTTGGIVGMLAGALWGVGGVPRRWVRGLEAGVVEECEGQVRGLMGAARLGS